MINIEFDQETVSAGDPIRASAYNAIINTIKELVSVLKGGITVSAALRVMPDVDPRVVRVTAFAAEQGLAHLAVAVHSEGEGPTHVVSGMRPNTLYRFTASAPGFGSISVERQVPFADDEGPLELALPATPKIVPSVFGASLGEAMGGMAQAGVRVVRVLDVFGRDVAPASVGRLANSSKVLYQVPDPGSLAEEANLVISASLEVKPTVKVPKLVGLSEAEAKRVLHQAGLTLGEVRVQKRRERG